MCWDCYIILEVYYIVSTVAYIDPITLHCYCKSEVAWRLEEYLFFWKNIIYSWHFILFQSRLKKKNKLKIKQIKSDNNDNRRFCLDNLTWRKWKKSGAPFNHNNTWWVHYEHSCILGEYIEPFSIYFSYSSKTIDTIDFS